MEISYYENVMDLHFKAKVSTPCTFHFALTSNHPKLIFPALLRMPDDLIGGCVAASLLMVFGAACLSRRTHWCLSPSIGTKNVFIQDLRRSVPTGRGLDMLPGCRRCSVICTQNPPPPSFSSLSLFQLHSPASPHTHPVSPPLPCFLLFSSVNIPVEPFTSPVPAPFNRIACLRMADRRG